MTKLGRGAFLTYHSQLALVNTKCNTWVVFYNSDELRLWFRQGQLTIESSNSDLDKVLVTYSQVESNQFKFPYVDLNFLFLLKPLYFIVIIYLITLWLMKSIHNCKPFCTVSFFNNWVNYVIYHVSSVFVHRSMCLI